MEWTVFSIFQTFYTFYVQRVFNLDYLRKKYQFTAKNVLKKLEMYYSIISIET